MMTTVPDTDGPQSQSQVKEDKDNKNVKQDEAKKKDKEKEKEKGTENDKNKKIERNLRDHLLDALSRVPGTRDFHLHVLVTSPRKGTAGGLFPFAKPRPPRVYEQEILLLLSEQHVDASTGVEKPRTIVCAIETTVFSVPATRSAVVYVSKVDSTGQGLRDAPKATGTLVRALLSYYVDPRTRPVDAQQVWVQLFARAQGQYLFPNSTEWEGKKPLSDVQLCGWWKRLLTKVKEGVEGVEGIEKVGLYFVLPGLSESEAGDALRVGCPPNSSGTTGGWVYGHPYSQTDIALPCPLPTGEKNLGHYIPSFEDDPKSRFIDEIAYTTEGEIKSPQRKRAKTVTTREGEGTSSASASSATATGKSHTTEDARPLGELSKVGADEFWERMSFRQECVAGAVTGFFALGVSGGSEGGEMILPGAGEVSLQVKKRVMSTLLTGVEFSTAERAAKATETVEGAIRGLCEGITNAGRRQNSQTLQVPTTPPRRNRPLLEDESSPNPFSEPVASLETYYGHIYGTVSTRNAVSAGATRRDGQGAVRVLAARRKRKG